MGEMIVKTNPICPYCSQALDKMPGRKKKCPHCGNNMYVRTRPVDRQRVLVTERGAQDIDAQWATIGAKQQAMRFVDETEFNKEKDALSARSGREPSDFDVLWTLHDKHLIEHAKMNNWGLYRNTRLAMAELLVTDGKRRQALDIYLEVVYLDANGPSNIGGATNPDLFKELPPFNPESAFMAPGILAEINMLAEELNLPDAELCGAFLAVGQRACKNLKLPASPEEGCRRFMGERVGK
ncbi:MAG: hypothetical protein HZB91_13195 [Elusimicrobia bacterium]|nr:hypothetical protein [Elusimicrobiota bacterium]